MHRSWSSRTTPAPPRYIMYIMLYNVYIYKVGVARSSGRRCAFRRRRGSGAPDGLRASKGRDFMQEREARERARGVGGVSCGRRWGFRRRRGRGAPDGLRASKGCDIMRERTRFHVRQHRGRGAPDGAPDSLRAYTKCGVFEMRNSRSCRNVYLQDPVL